MRDRVGIAAAALALVALAAGVVSVRRVREQVSVREACEAVGQGDFADALARTSGLTGAGPTARAAAQCRCYALIATGSGAACETLMEDLLGRPQARSWSPEPPLAIHLIQTWRDAGRPRDAAALAKRAARVYPQDPDLFYLELVTRAPLEDEQALMEELAARIPDEGLAAARMRVTLAQRHLVRGEPRQALARLGEAPPPGAGPGLALWFETRGLAHANAGDLAGVDAVYQRWREAGGHPDELLARYARTLSLGGLASPREPIASLLRRGLAAAEALGDERLQETLAIRLIMTLAGQGRDAEAAAVYDDASRRFELSGLSRRELQRSARGSPPGASGDETATLRFRFPKPAPGATLLLSPPEGAPADAGYESRPVPASGGIATRRPEAQAPLRWVYRDSASHTLASGTLDPAPGEVLEIAVAPRPPQPLRTWQSARRPGDGRRRITLLLLDCADWRIAGYLMARGELPVLRSLLAKGHRAVLTSDPPLTAAALESLVWPGEPGAVSFVGWLHRFGTELAGLESVGENPLAALRWVLPERGDLFAALGAGPRSAANLLFSHGGIQAGRHSEVTGPGGVRRRVRVSTSARDLTAPERERFPGLAAVRERDAVHLRGIAAELDVARELASEGELDLVALRVEPLDILTHAHFAEAAAPGQDDGRPLLFDVYRYIDARIGEIDAVLDADDVLVVMSDHGIRSALEHASEALFVAVGAGVPHGRAPGSPDLRGVPRVLADLLGVGVDWPDTGVAPAGTALARATIAPEAAGSPR